MAAGGALLLWAARTVRRNTGKATLLALAGTALLGIGRRQRRASRSGETIDTGIEVSLDDDDDTDDDGGKRVSDDAHVGATQNLGAGRVADETRSDSGSDEEANPRGTSDRSDVEDDADSTDDTISEDDAHAESDEGEEFEFVEEKEPGTHREPHLDDEHDTRLDTDEGDERTQIDVSDSAMADEASEAAGPQPEQAYPAMEGTDPEPKSENVPPRDLEGVDRSGEPDSDDETDDEADVEADEDSEVEKDEHEVENDESEDSS